MPAGFHFQPVRESEAEQFGSTLLCFCTALGMKLSTRVGPGHGIWMRALTRGPQREREEGMTWQEQGMDLGHFR